MDEEFYHSIISISGSMCIKLYGKISKNEPTSSTTVPGVPNDSKWKCNGDGSKNSTVETFVANSWIP